MRGFAKSFYRSKRWQATRAAYAASVGGLCESCAAAGLIVPGEIVHHKVPLTPDTIHNPSVALDFSNLELVCRNCHAARHPQETSKRWTVDVLGHITAREVSPLSLPGTTPGRPRVGEVGNPLARGKGGVGHEPARSGCRKYDSNRA